MSPQLGEMRSASTLKCDTDGPRHKSVIDALATVTWPNLFDLILEFALLCYLEEASPTIRRSLMPASMRGLAAFGFSLVTLWVPSTANAAVTGSWSGPGNSITRCRNGVVRSDSGSFALALTEQDGGVTGLATLEVAFLDADCQLVSREMFWLPLTGTVGGNTLTATVLVPFVDDDPVVAISATVNGPTMSLTFTAHETTASAALTQTSTTPPDSRFTGAWSGNYLMSDGFNDPCPVVTSSGPISGTFFQAGDEIAAFMTFFDTKHFDPFPCRLHEHYDLTAFMSGTVSGNTAIGPGAPVWRSEVLDVSNRPVPITLTVSGNTVTGVVGEEGGFATFTMSRNSATPPPLVTRFDAPAPSITAGQSSTLRWDTFNATSVTIDHGVGTHGTSGSATITPLVTTTYTLTATVSGGTATAKTTVTVLGGGSKRRSARH